MYIQSAVAITPGAVGWVWRSNLPGASRCRALCPLAPQGNGGQWRYHQRSKQFLVAHATFQSLMFQLKKVRFLNAILFYSTVKCLFLFH